MSDKSRLLFSVRESKDFPRALWERFQSAARRDGHTPISMLRRLIDRYLETRPP